MRILELPLAELRPIWAPVAWVSLLTNLLMLVPTLYMLQVFDRVLPGGNEWTLLFLSLITLYLYGVLAGSEWLRSRMLINSSVRFEQQSWPAIFKKQMGMQAAGTGGWQSEWLSSLSEVRQFLSGPSLLIAIDLCMTPIFLLALCILHPWLAVFAIVMMAIQFALAHFSHAWLQDAQRFSTQAWENENRTLRVALRHFETALALGIGSALHGRWRQARVHAMHASHQNHALQGKVTSVTKFVRYAQQGLGLGLGAWLAIRGEISPGAMIAANVLTTRSLGPIEQWASSWTQMHMAINSYKKLGKLIEEVTTPHPQTTWPSAPQLTEPWALQQLLLLIEHRPQPVLSHLSLTIAPAQITAIHGPSGAGKSSLLKAMLGQWPAQYMKGQIRLGPHLANQAFWLEHGSRIGYLPQGVELLEASISENIARMGDTNPEQVVAAAKKIGIHELILALPQGYDTRLTGNFTVSNGLRQRIGMARALYGNPEWVLLDEPSASLDEASTRQLMDTLRKLPTEGVGVVLTTHNQQLIQMADRRLRLESGMLVTP